MKMHIQKFVMILFLALTLAGGIAVSTSAMAFASTGTSTSASTQTMTKVNNASSSCTSYIVPQMQWETYLEAVSVSNPSLIYWFQTQPFFGQATEVNIWVSFNGGKNITPLGTFLPPFPGPNYYVFYSNNIPFVNLCGYSAYLAG